MSRKYKFLFFILFSLSSFSLLLFLFMQTNYAREEKAYFNQYPKLEMARRHLPAKAPLPLARTPILIKETGPRSEPMLPMPIQKNQISPIFNPIQKPIFNPIQKKVISRPPEDNIASLTPEYASPTRTITAATSPQEDVPTVNENVNMKKKEKPAGSLQPLTTIQIDGHQAAQLGYESYDAGAYTTAVIHFEQALKYMQNTQDIHKQLAYAYKILGQNNKAIAHFKAAIDQYADTKVPFPLKREIEQLENRFNVNGYIIYRDESSGTQQLGADLTQSQTGIEVSYQPKNIGFNNGKKIQFYGRLLSAMDTDSLNPNSDSYQAGIGTRLKPFTHHNLVLSAERLVKVGVFARND